jgi:hypothetical protein
LGSDVEKARTAWKDVPRKSSLDLPDLPEVDIEREVGALRERMQNPAKGVKVVLLADMSRFELMKSRGAGPGGFVRPIRRASNFAT